MLLQSINKKNISDNLYDRILNYKQNNILTRGLTESQIKRFKTCSNKFSLENGKLFTTIKSKSLNVKNHKVELIAPRDRDNVLQVMYNDVEQSRNGRDSFYFKVALKYMNISRSYVQEWLRKQENYQLHLIQPREKLLQPETVKSIGEKLMIDLIDMTAYKGSNGRKGWVLTGIDVFSKFGFAKAITTKKADKVLDGLKDILLEYRTKMGMNPQLIHSDNGSEFTNRDYKEYLRQNNIKTFYGQTYTPQQQGNIERFNRTLKGLIFSYITKRKSHNLPFSERYVDVLDQILKNYNDSIHSSIKDKPKNILKPNRSNLKQIKLVDKRIEKFGANKKELPTLLINDRVRLHILTRSEHRKEKIFAKKYLPQWSKEIYEVVRRFNLNNPLKKSKYKVKKVVDEDGNNVNILIDKLYYRHDLQKLVN